MTRLTALLVLLVIAPAPRVWWMGTVSAEVVVIQPGARHATRTLISVSLLQEPGIAGTLRLRSVRSRYRMHATITGQTSCDGSADALLSQPAATSTIDASGAYQLVIERGFFGWACGVNVLASGARDVAIGSGLDPKVRHVTDDGRMVGHYEAVQRTDDSTYDFKVEWTIKRESGAAG